MRSRGLRVGASFNGVRTKGYKSPKAPKIPKVKFAKVPKSKIPKVKYSSWRSSRSKKIGYKVGSRRRSIRWLALLLILMITLYLLHLIF